MTSEFWQGYRSIVQTFGVSPEKAEWFVKWAVKFAQSTPGVPLRERTEIHINTFLSDLRKQNLPKWRMEQAEFALKISFRVI